MVPFVSTVSEVVWRYASARPTPSSSRAANLPAAARERFSFGTMIELPRAVLRAAEIAELCRLLLVRHQRPDANHLRHFPRRRPGVPLAYQRKGPRFDPPIPLPRTREWRGEKIALAIERWQEGQPRPEDRDSGGEHAGDPSRFPSAGLAISLIMSARSYRVPVARLTLALLIGGATVGQLSTMNTLRTGFNPDTAKFFRLAGKLEYAWKTIIRNSARVRVCRDYAHKLVPNVGGTPRA